MISFLTLLAILFCLIGSAFFSGIETGIVSIHRLRLHHLVRHGDRKARITEIFVRDSDRLLGTTLVGNNLCNVALTTLSTGLALQWIGPLGRPVATALITLVVLIFCEYLPKAWFYSRPEERCVPMAGVLLFFDRLFKPLSRTVIALSHWATPRNSSALVRRGPFISRDSLHYLTRDSERGGYISGLERLMIDRVLQLQNRTARQIMTPLENIIRVNRGDPVRKLYRLVREHNLIRIPVLDPERNEFVGVINLFNLLENFAPAEDDTVDRFMRPPLFISENTRADDILPILRRHRHPIALVRDADRNVIGLVTTDDILNAIGGSLPSRSTVKPTPDRS